MLALVRRWGFRALAQFGAAAQTTANNPQAL